MAVHLSDVSAKVVGLPSLFVQVGSLEEAAREGLGLVAKALNLKISVSAKVVGLLYLCRWAA